MGLRAFLGGKTRMWEVAVVMALKIVTKEDSKITQRSVVARNTAPGMFLMREHCGI